MRSNPARSKEVQRNSAKNKNTWVRKLILLYPWQLLAVLIIVLLSAGLIYGSGASNFVHNRLSNLLKYVYASAGLTLQNVYLEGQKYTTTSQILSALPVKIGQPILSIPLDKIKTNLEKLEWVKFAAIERHLPNTLYIGIIERTPLALWQKNKKLYLIDSDGAIITNKNLAAFANFIILVGDEAPFHAANLFSIIRQDTGLFNRITSAIRVGERRWNIRLDNGLEIKLPEAHPEKAWDYVVNLYTQKNLFAQGVRMIDLRDGNKLYIE